MKDDTTTIAFNASNRKRWLPGLQTHVFDLLEGAEAAGTRLQHALIAAAWATCTASCAAAGCSVYPGDSRPGI